MRISDWSSDVCSSDLQLRRPGATAPPPWPRLPPMSMKNEDGEPGVPPTVALYSILGFWFFYAVLVTLRASVMGFEAQGTMSARRAVVTVIGIVVTWVLYLCLRRFDRQPLATRIIAAFTLAAPFALAPAAANFYVFNIYDPASLFPDSDYQKYASEQGFALMQLVEDALSRYFFLSSEEPTSDLQSLMRIS